MRTRIATMQKNPRGGEAQRTGSMRKTGSVTPWYLSGGINLANCIAAYQAKGAASKLASLVNLASPGNGDFVETGNIEWSVTNGWYAPNNNDYLTTTLATLPTTYEKSIIIKTDYILLSGFVFTDINGFFYIRSSSVYRWRNGGNIYTTYTIPDGNHVLGFNGKDMILDNNDVGDNSGTNASSTTIRFLSDLSGNRYQGKIQAIAIYDTITFIQWQAVATAMNAL